MLVVGQIIIDDFIRAHADGRGPLLAWIAEAEAANWTTPNDIRGRFASASSLPDNTVVFNIKGNAFRLVVGVSYDVGVVEIQRVGTHAEYDKWRL